MSDEMDLVQQQVEQFQEAALKNHRLNSSPTCLTSLKNCINCNEEIPVKRREAMPGCRRCIDCQIFHENWRAL